MRRSTEPTQPAELRAARPWHSFAALYFKAGWYPLPLPPKKKKSPPTGATGKYELPDEDLISKWLKEYQPKGNIALRVPDDVIGIDVDAYDRKIGKAGLAELERDLGKLPKTWALTARADGVSGIRFFRVPVGLHWSGEPIPDVQIIQNHHRYAVAYPSVHPDTRGIYRWYPPGAALNGAPVVTVDREIPKVSELPALPTSWVEALTGGRTWNARPADVAASRTALMDWLTARPDGELCRLMAKETSRAVAEMEIGGAHDTLNSRLYSIISLASEGHVGVTQALAEVRLAFEAEVTTRGRKGRRSSREAVLEFDRARDGAVRIMLGSIRDGESVLEAECACAESSFTWGEKLGVQVVEDPDSERGVVGVGAGSGGGRRRAFRRRGKLGRAKRADKYPMDDSGNADHLLDILDGSAYYIAGERNWTFWSPKDGCWIADQVGGRIIQAAQLVGKRQRELAQEFSDVLDAKGMSVKDDVGGDLSGRITALQRQGKLSSSYHGLHNMGKVAQSQSRAEMWSEQFDTDEKLLACPNGTVVLDPAIGRAGFRPADRLDFCSMTTGTSYLRGARAGEWSSYLRQFLPDPAVRRWVQKLIGYCLVGGNPERLMVFAVGLTSTGKSTFVNTITTALGGYAGTMNLSLFRDNQDEKPRADLVRGLGKRLLTASEASAEWYLHGDQIKRLTGNDPIKARLLYSSIYVERIPCYVPLVATNTMPQIHGADLALRRRLVQIPFTSTVAVIDEDHELARALRTSAGCRSAVLAWAVRGWERYCADGLGDRPDAVAVATQTMHEELSDLDVFLTEVTSEHRGGWVRAEELFERWRMWSMENNLKDDWSSNKFGRELSGRGYGRDIKKIDGEVVRIRCGLVWRK